MNKMLGSSVNTSAEESIQNNLLMPATLLISSMSFIIFCFEGVAISLDMTGFLAIVAGLIILGLVPVSLICRRSGRTFSSIV